MTPELVAEAGGAGRMAMHLGLVVIVLAAIVIGLLVRRRRQRQQRTDRYDMPFQPSRTDDPQERP